MNESSISDPGDFVARCRLMKTQALEERVAAVRSQPAVPSSSEPASECSHTSPEHPQDWEDSLTSSRSFAGSNDSKNFSQISAPISSDTSSSSDSESDFHNIKSCQNKRSPDAYTRINGKQCKTLESEKSLEILQFFGYKSHTFPSPLFSLQHNLTTRAIMNVEPDGIYRAQQQPPPVQVNAPRQAYAPMAPIANIALPRGPTFPLILGGAMPSLTPHPAPNQMQDEQLLHLLHPGDHSLHAREPNNRQNTGSTSTSTASENNSLERQSNNLSTSTSTSNVTLGTIVHGESNRPGLTNRGSPVPLSAVNSPSAPTSSCSQPSNRTSTARVVLQSNSTQGRVASSDTGSTSDSNCSTRTSSLPSSTPVERLCRVHCC